MPYLQTRGVDHYYEWIPAAPDPVNSKPVMVLLHGWGGSCRYWRPTAEALANQFDCLLYDLRGFGQSQHRSSSDMPSEKLDLTDYELETYAEDLADLLDQLGLSRVYLNGHSTGTSIATFFLNLYPERVERAVLTCGGIFEYEPKSFQQFHQFGGYVVKFRPAWLAKIPGMDRLFMARFLHQPIAPELRQAFLEDFLMADYQAALGTMMTAVSEKAATVMPSEYSQISVPTLLISGEYDQIIPVAMGDNAAMLNPEKIEHVVIPQTSHFPMLEDPQTYLRCVRHFLQDY